MDPFLEMTVRGTGSKGVMDFLMVVSLSNTGSSSWRLLGFTSLCFVVRVQLHLGVGLKMKCVRKDDVPALD